MDRKPRHELQLAGRRPPNTALKHADHALIRSLKAELRARANAERARQAQAYMKSSMAFCGVAVPVVRQLAHTACSSRPPLPRLAWKHTVLSLYRRAEFREERYAALGIAGFKAYRNLHDFSALKLYEELITTGAWWDLVDECAPRVGLILEHAPGRTRPELLKWSRSDNVWKRRVAILCQGRFKQQTDLELLYACIEPSLDEPEFFLQKGIGWALRNVAWYDAKEAVRYVRQHKQALSNLAKREALKNLLKQGVVKRIP